MPESTGTRCMAVSIVYADKSSDDGMRNKEQHKGKGKGRACATVITCATP